MADALALRQAMTQVKINIGQIGPLPADFQIMVQPMVKGLAEVLLGFKRDADAGAIVILAVGDLTALAQAIACFSQAAWFTLFRPDHVGSKNPKHLPAQSHAPPVEGRARVSCPPGAAAACAGLAAVSVCAVFMIWK